MRGSKTTNETFDGDEDLEEEIIYKDDFSMKQIAFTPPSTPAITPPPLPIQRFLPRSSSTSDLHYQSNSHNELSWDLESNNPNHHSDDEFISNSATSLSFSQLRYPLTNRSTSYQEKEEKEEREDRESNKESTCGEEDRSEDEKDQNERGKRSKRLNKSATLRLTQWLVDHLSKSKERKK